MKKILLAIYDDLLRRTYAELFREERFEVLETNNGKEALNLALKENPDIILADVTLLEMGGLRLMQLLLQNPFLQKIPVVIFSSLERQEEKNEAMDLGAKDFIVGAITSPREVIAKIKIQLGFQKTYQFLIEEKNFDVAKEIKKDLGFSSRLECPRCGFPLVLFLMRDLSKGKDYFKLSFTCQRCGYTE